jgi:AcrR family transcriptional regulator
MSKTHEPESQREATAGPDAPKRQPGRPRTVSDEAIYMAALAVLAQHGSEGITLARVAELLGVTPAAIRQRYGSKRGLLVEMSRRRVAQTEQRFQITAEARSSPLAALQAAFVGDLGMVDSPQQVANAFSAYTDNIGDDEMRASFNTELRTMEGRISELLTLAAEAGEIRVPVTPELVATLLAAVEGTMLVWAIVPRGDLKDRVREAVEVVLGLRPGQSSPGPVLPSPPHGVDREE